MPKLRSLPIYRLAPLLLAILAGSPAATNAQVKENGIAAVVNSVVITRNDVEESVKAQEQMAQFEFRNDPAGLAKELKTLRENAIDSLIDRELILAEFRKVGGSIKPQYVEDDINTIIRENFAGNRDAFVTELARGGMTLKKFRAMREKMIIVQVMRGRYANQSSPPTPLEVREFYEKNIDRFRDKDMIKISTLTIPKFTGDATVTPESQKELANDLRKRILAGTDFASIAKTYSRDSRADDGGEWPWMERSQMKKSIGDAAFALKEGGLSPVVEDEGVYLLITVDAKKLGSAEPLENVRSLIERMIRQEKSKAALDAWLEGLRRKANIKRFDR
jgi:peptidyl-prolyl cis-trans isomerase SurA